MLVSVTVGVAPPGGLQYLLSRGPTVSLWKPRPKNQGPPETIVGTGNFWIGNQNSELTERDPAGRVIRALKDTNYP